MTLCEQIEIDDRTRMIVGQELDMVAGQPDVCNVIVHRAGDLLVLVDSGVTSVFRDAIRSAADDLAPWSNILLLTTHGHPDHVGNNDLIAELGDGLIARTCIISSARMTRSSTAITGYPTG